MPHVQFSIDGVEVDPCEHMQTILETLQSCDDALGRRLLGRPGTRLRRPPGGLTPQQPRRSDGSAAPSAQPVPTSPVAGAEFLVDPDSPADFPTFIDPRAGFLEDGGVNVMEPNGTVTRKPLVPLDLKLIQAIEGKRTAADKVIGGIIVGVSQVAAKLLNLPEDTISGNLARAGRTSKRAVHLDLLIPILKVAPPITRQGILDFLTDEADISLLERDIFDLTKQVEILDRGFDVPFLSPPKDEQKAWDRIRGNLEILRIEQQEEF